VKKCYCMTIMAIGFLCFIASAEAKTVTEGTLELDRIATKISSDLMDYANKKEELVGNIKSVQKGIHKLKDDYSKAGTQKEKTIIKARTLKETSQLLDFYSRFYNLNIEKVKTILPNLEKMKTSARRGTLGRRARELKDPEFKKNLKSLYANLSGMALIFNNPNIKKEIAGLLKEHELLYRQGEKGINVFDNITNNIDKVADYLRSVHAKTVLRSKILQQKKEQTELAVELMRYVLALRPIQHTIRQINPEGVMDVPEIDFAEFVDPLISDDDADGDAENMSYSVPDADSALMNFRENGPKFLE